MQPKIKFLLAFDFSLVIGTITVNKVSSKTCHLCTLGACKTFVLESSKIKAEDKSTYFIGPWLQSQLPKPHADIRI